MSRKYCVWPTGVPDVPTVLWEQEDWQRWEDIFRPKDYEGGRRDTEAWKKYAQAKKRAVHLGLLEPWRQAISRKYGQAESDRWFADAVSHYDKTEEN